jgi:hypothetical protein
MTGNMYHIYLLDVMTGLISEKERQLAKEKIAQNISNFLEKTVRRIISLSLSRLQASHLQVMDFAVSYLEFC